MAAFDIHSTAGEVAATLAENITGKNVLISGSTLGGLGAETARVIARYADLVVLAGRNQEYLDKTISSIQAETPSANLRSLILDLGSLAGARKAAAEVNAYAEPIHVLINSAGIMAAPYSRTADGFESHMGINHFAPFLFTALIFKRIAAAGTKDDPARVVNISSGGHRITGIRFDDLDFSDGKAYQKFAGYGQSKTANVLFANEIARRAGEKGVPVVAYSLHPGVIDGTNLGEYINDDDLRSIGNKNEKGEWTIPIKSLGEGAATFVVAAFDPSILSQPGAYLVDANICEAARQEHARSQEFGQKLWELSEQKVNEKFVI